MTEPPETVEIPTTAESARQAQDHNGGRRRESDRIRIAHASETRDSNLAIASVIVPFVGPLVVAPIVGWFHGYLSLPRPIFMGALILIMAAGVGLPIAAAVRIRLSRGTRTGLGWAMCGLTVALLQVAIITFLIIAG